MTWDIWYIDEGFLVWTNPSIYLSHGDVNWVVPLIFPYFLSSGLISEFWFYYYYYFICIHPGLSLVYYSHWSPVLIILYHACSLLDITYYLSACSYMPVLTIWFSIMLFFIQIYRYTCACPCTPLGIHHTTRWGVSNSPKFVCSDFKAWSLWILPVADQTCTVKA